MTTPTNPVARILIVDDHPAVREALTIRISSQPGLQVCGEAADVAEALRLASETSPDVAVVDIALKDGNGIDLIKRLKSHGSTVRAIVWSMYSESLYAERALRAGAMGYVNKGQSTGEIIEAIRQVLNDKVYYTPVVRERLLKQALGQTLEDRETTPINQLSDREVDVFRMLGEGLKTVEIASALHLSVKTVETYRDRIRQKLGLENSVEVARSALLWILEQEKGNSPSAASP